MRGLLIEPSDSQVAAIRPHSAVLDERLSFHGGLVSGIAWRVYDEMRRMDASSPLAIEGLLLELVAA